MTIEKLSRFALLKISGTDAGGFLQGQLSNDVNALDVKSNGAPVVTDAVDIGRWQLSGYCNPKGRLLALFYLFKQGDDYFALLDQDLLEPIAKRLTMFVMRSKVTITHMAEAAFAGALSVESAAQWSGLVLGTPKHGDVISSGSKSLLAVNKRFLVVMHGGGPTARQELSASDLNWRRADIDEGLPWVNAATSERFIPQMLNLDLVGGISFKKGCYTGQEIVARMHYLGNLKQRMFLAGVEQLPDATRKLQVQPGDKIFADRELSKPIGNLVTVCESRALVVIRLEYFDQSLYLDANTIVRPDKAQPYKIPG